MGAFEDTDEDDLSDISERSREDDTSDPGVNKTGPFTTRDSFEERTDSRLQTSSTSAFQAKTVPTLVNTKTSGNERQALGGRSSDADKPALSAVASPRAVVKARPLEYSDSDDTTSGADSQPGKPSITDTFYSPDESVDDGEDTDEQQSSFPPPYTPGKIDTSRPSNQTPVESPIKSVPKQGNAASRSKQDDRDDQSSDESSSGESQKTPVPAGKTALGERCIFSSVISGFYTNKYLVPLCVCGVSFRLLQKSQHQQQQHWKMNMITASVFSPPTAAALLRTRASIEDLSLFLF